MDESLKFSLVDAVFESTSGWTTTGATVISNIDNSINLLPIQAVTSMVRRYRNCSFSARYTSYFRSWRHVLVQG